MDHRTRVSILCLSLAVASCGEDAAGGCVPEDADGIIGGRYTFVLVVNDEAFSPAILKVQNTAEVALTLRSEGTGPHGFEVLCYPTPNDDGCPTESCFPEKAKIASVEPGATANATFAVPRVEGIYEFRSPVAGDRQTGQFVVQ